MFIIVDNGDSFSVSSLQHILEQRALPARTLNCRTDFQEIANDPVSGIFLSGGAPELDVRDPEILSKVPLDVACLINCTAPVMAICFGFELLIQLSGGIIAKLDTPVPQDCVNVDILAHKGIFAGLPKAVCMREFNSLGPMSVPTSFETLARSHRSSVEAVQHRSRAIYATLFHPEARDLNGRYQPGGEHIIENFIQICQKAAGSHSRHEATSENKGL
jgi:anthranilate/para-aminobenzoate synthase component II